MNVRLVIVSVFCLFLNTFRADAGDGKQPALAEFEIFTGRVEAVQRVDLRARVTGYLTKINFKDGDDVKKDQLLFEIDDRTYRAAVDLAEARLKTAEVRVDLTKKDLDRAERLVQTKGISLADYDITVAAHAEAKAKLVVAATDRERAKIDLDYTRIRAPIAGRIGRAQLTPGNLVKADDMMLTTIASVDPVHVYFDVDERTVLQLRKRPVAVDMGTAIDTNYPHKGQIDFVDSRVDPKTATIRLRAVFANADGKLLPGMFVRVRVAVDGPRKAPEPPKKMSALEPMPTSAKVKELLKERYQMLSKAVNIVTVQYQAGQTTTEAVTRAQRAALEAGLELCSTQAERIEFLRAQVKLAEHAHNVAEALVKAGKATALDELQAHAMLLEARVRLLREEEKTAGK